MSLRAFLPLLVTLAGATRSAARAEPEYKVIVHPSNPATQVSRSFVRDAFLKKAIEWQGGRAVRPVDLSSRFSVHRWFVGDVLRKTEAQLRIYWTQQIFSGKGVPPPRAESPAAVIRYVLANPGAIGYLPGNTSHGAAKVVVVR